MLAPRAFVVLLPDEPDETFKRATAAEAAFHGAGVPTQSFRTVAVKSQESHESNRPLQLLQSRDAHKIYEAMHQGPVAVLGTGKARVRVDVYGSVAFRRTITLERFVRHKAAYGSLQDPDATSRLVDDLLGWPGMASLTDERDHRILPMHVFSERDWVELHSPDGVSAFEQTHGGPSRLVDHAGRQWKRTSALHGGDVLHVRGLELRAGHHWDVQSPNGDGRMSTHVTAWKFSRGAYVNVYPNAVVRPGQSSGSSAEKIWDELGAENAKRSRVTPKKGTRKHGGHRSR